MSTRAMWALTLGLALLVSAASHAAEQGKYPLRPIRVVVLAMASEKRVPVAPELPTFIESGVQVVGGTWVGILAPTGTPREIVQTLSREMQQVLKRPDLRERFLTLGIDAVGNTPDEFSQFLRDEVAKWEK